MQMKPLGSSGLVVSELCFGAMTFGGIDGLWGQVGRLDQSQADALVSCALAAGINFFDTANIYADGRSEQMLGQSLRNLSVARDDVVIATKVGSAMGPGSHLRGASRRHVLAQCAASLKRLGLEHIDLYQIHAFDPTTPIEETLEALNTLVQAGAVRYIGLSNWAAWQVMKAVGIASARQLAPITSLQAYYTLVGRDLERDVIPRLESEGLGLMVWSPLAGGYLTGKYAAGRDGSAGRLAGLDFPPIDRQRGEPLLQRIQGIAQKHGVTASQVSIAWLLAQPAVSTVILGAKSASQLHENRGDPAPAGRCRPGGARRRQPPPPRVPRLAPAAPHRGTGPAPPLTAGRSGPPPSPSVSLTQQHHPAMSIKKFRVGIIGADTAASWAGASHIPALQSHPLATLAAVATRQEASARAAAQAFGAERWYADPYDLIRDETIDIVTIAVKVPAHRELVLAALAAGKAVYCEAPLGATLAQTQEMAAASHRLHTAIGLQGRHNPSVRRAADIVASGRLGRLMSAQVKATTFGFGPQSTAAYDYFNKAASGASFLTITTAHVLDIVEAVAGQVVEVDARTQTLWPEIEIVDTGGTSTREIADHVDLIAKTVLGASVSVQVLAGVAPEDAAFIFELRGSSGTLRLTGSHAAGVQVGDLSLSASVDFEAPQAPVSTGTGPTAAAFWAGAAINVGEVYASLARDLTNGTFETPGFSHAAANARLVDAVDRAARLGARQRVLA